MSANATITAAKSDSSPRIRIRVLFFFGLALVVLLAVMATTIFSLVSVTEARQWLGRQLEASRNAVFRVETFLELATRQLVLAAEFSDIQERGEILSEIIASEPQFLELVYADRQGRILANQFRDAALLANQVTLSQANWFVASLDQPEYTIYVSPIQLSADLQPYLILSAPYAAGDGVIGARISLTVFSDIVSGLSFGETGRAYVADDNGAILAHTDPQVVISNASVAGRDEFERALLRPLDLGLEDEQFLALTEPYINFQGVPVIGIAERIPIVSWVLFTEIQEDEVFANTQTAIQTLLVVTLLIFVLTMLVISEVQRRIIFKPLSELRYNVEQVSQGKLDILYQATSRDEIGETIQAFNDMARIVNERAIERDRLIRDLQAAKRLAEENSRLKSEFLSTMSHELRTPMNAIEGFVGIILSRMGGTDYNDKTATYLQRVRANSQRLLALINDFLDLSRVESGRLDLASQPFEPAKLAQRWRSELGVLAENKQIGFEVQVDPELPKTLIGDEEAISKVAINLIGNAIKFTDKGKVTVSLELSGKEWNIIVRDTGIGIPPHAREFVFEEFRQVDQSSRRKHGGTGLGLAIVQKYTRSMGGQVTLKSEVGQGSEFTVTLPMVTVQQMNKA